MMMMVMESILDAQQTHTEHTKTQLTSLPHLYLAHSTISMRVNSNVPRYSSEDVIFSRGCHKLRHMYRISMKYASQHNSISRRKCPRRSIADPKYD